MKTKTKQNLRYTVLLAVFVLMCVLRLWFTMFLVLAAGIAFTIATRKRVFCSSYCPMGAVQDAAYKKESSRKGRFFYVLKRRKMRVAASILFWGYIVAAVLLLKDRPQSLWIAMLALMLGSAAVAIIFQAVSTKRAWCSTICPYGNLYGSIVNTSAAKRKNR